MKTDARSAAAATLLVAAATLTTTLGCSKTEPPPSSTVAPPTTRPPVDRTAPGELAEGPDKAFGLPVPRRMAVKANFPDAVHAIGNVPREDVANYVRSRVKASAIETGPAKTVFTGVTLASQPGKTLRIEVSGHDAVTELVVSDRTPAPIDPSVPPEERMRKAGLRPDGKPLDPTKLD